MPWNVSRKIKTRIDGFMQKVMLAAVVIVVGNTSGTCVGPKSHGTASDRSVHCHALIVDRMDRGGSA